jgi:hypothetical protein
VKVRKYSADEIIASGKDLVNKRDKLSDIEFREYIRKKYNIQRNRATGWIKAAIRFESRLDLIKDLSETIIVELASPVLSMAEVEQLIADRRSGKIKPDSRSMQQVVSRIKKSKELDKPQQDKPALPSIAPLQDEEIKHDTKHLLLGKIQQLQQEAMIHNGVTEEELCKTTVLSILDVKRKQLQLWDSEVSRFFSTKLR